MGGEGGIICTIKDRSAEILSTPQLISESSDWTVYCTIHYYETGNIFRYRTWLAKLEGLLKNIFKGTVAPD